MSLPTLSRSEKDLFIHADRIAQVIEFLNTSPPIVLGGSSADVNLNSANTDTEIRIKSPTTNYRVHAVLVKNKGTTASLTTATAGLFSAAAAGGLAIAANQALSAITANAVNTDANLLALTQTVGNRTWINSTSLFFRVGLFKL